LALDAPRRRATNRTTSFALETRGRTRFQPDAAFIRPAVGTTTRRVPEGRHFGDGSNSLEFTEAASRDRQGSATSSYPRAAGVCSGPWPRARGAPSNMSSTKTRAGDSGNGSNQAAPAKLVSVATSGSCRCHVVTTTIRRSRDTAPRAARGPSRQPMAAVHPPIIARATPTLAERACVPG
jgi:hypothetical protein